MANNHISLTELFTDIADAIRSKTGSAEQIVADDFPGAIGEIRTGTGEYDTSDATATAGDIARGKTAYAAGNKITGTVKTVDSGAQGVNTDAALTVINKSDGQIYIGTKKTFTEDILYRAGSTVTEAANASQFGDAAAADVAQGKTFTSAAGLLVTGTKVDSGGIDTSDATATADDIAQGATAYVNGELLNGTVRVVAPEESVGWAMLTPSTNESGLIGFSQTIKETAYSGIMWKNGAKVAMRANPETFGDATAEDVAAGKTFTSAAGLLVAGTMEAGGGSGGVKVTEYVVTEDADRSLWLNEQGIKLVRGVNLFVSSALDYVESEAAAVQGAVTLMLILWDGVAFTADTSKNTTGARSHIRGFQVPCSNWSRFASITALVAGNTSAVSVAEDGTLTCTTSATGVTTGNYNNSFIEGGYTYRLLQAESEVVC